MTYQVVIPAAGQGKRMGVGKNKLLLELEGIPIFIHTLKIFEEDDWCKGIVLVVSPEDEAIIKSFVEKHHIKKVIHFVHGGAERQYSVFNGLQAIHESEIVLVHDGARPFVEKRILHELVITSKQHGAAVVAVPVKDTIKRVNNGEIVETVERSSLWAMQTPQAFRLSILKKAHEKAYAEKFLGTDEASLVERINYPVKIVQGSYHNMKITTPEDLLFAEAIFKKMRSC